MSQEDKKPKGLRMTPKMMDELFGSIEDEDSIPPGYSRIKETGEGEIMTRYKKIESKDIFSLRSLYDVDKPLQIPAVWLSILKNVRDDDRIAEIVENYEYLILRAERDELKSEVQRLISKINKIDKEYITSFEFSLEQTLPEIEDRERAKEFKKYMHHLWNNCRECSQGGMQNIKERLFEFEEIPKIARDNIEDTIKSLFAKKLPIFEKLQDKIERYATFQRAIKQYSKFESKEHRVGRPKEFDPEIIRELFNQLKAKEKFQKKNGSPHKTNIREEIRERLTEVKNGQEIKPSMKTIKRAT